MLSSEIAAELIHEGLRKGADFVDIYAERNSSSSLSFKSGLVDNVLSGVDFGIGIRLFFGLSSVYAYSNSKQKDDLIKLIHQMAASKQNINPAHVSFRSINEYLVPSKGHGAELREMIGIAQHLDKACRKNSSLVQQVEVGVTAREQEVQIFNSYGMMAHEKRPYFRVFSNVFVQDGNDMFSAYEAPGARGGIQVMEMFDMDQMADRLVRQAVTMLKADPCPAGTMPVVIDNGFGGVIFHEACGHLLETTQVEKKASPFWDKLGQMIANPAVSAVDDGTIPFGWGSLSIDDEGMPTQRTQLIKDGRLTSFMVDLMGSLKTGHQRTGSGRRQSYRFQPASRMRNTYIEPGKFSFDDLLHSAGDGLYAKTMGGGSVMPGTGEFNFSVLEGYLVKNGKIVKPVKGATLIGKGADVLKKISMVSNNLSITAGMCGSVSGMIPASVGQAALKVDEILVGGRS